MIKSNLIASTYKKYLPLFAVLVFIISVAIPKQVFILRDTKFKLISILEAKSKDSTQIFNFENSNGEVISVPFLGATKQKISYSVLNGESRSISLEVSKNVIIGSNGIPLVIKTENGQILISDSDKYILIEDEVAAKEFISTNLMTDSLPIPDSQFLKQTERKFNVRNTGAVSSRARALITHDYHRGREQKEVIDEIVTLTFLANQYFSNEGISLLFTDYVFYPEVSVFQNAFQEGDPYKVLEAGVLEHQKKLSESINLSVVFAKRYFQKAAGLAYMQSACVSPSYSVIFVSQSGTELSKSFGFSATLAHEFAHYLGASHDSEYYTFGPSLMAPSYQVLPFGFSEKSLGEIRANRNAAWFCFKNDSSLNENIEDSDSDFQSDFVEDSMGTDKTDSGSRHFEAMSESYAAWNGFKNQSSIGELLAGEDGAEVDISIHDLNGKTLLKSTIGLAPRSEYDMLISELGPQFRDTYGLVKFKTRRGGIFGTANTYSHSGSFQDFGYIAKQEIFSPNILPEHVAFNYGVPSIYPRSTISWNWLSILNLSDKENIFDIYLFNSEGGLITKVPISVPPLGRRDLQAQEAKSTVYGSYMIMPRDLKANVKFHSFNTRYFVSEKGFGRVLGSSIIDGSSGRKDSQDYIIDNQESAASKVAGNTWLELTNTSREIASVELESREADSGKLTLARHLIKPYSTLHLGFPDTGTYEIKVKANRPIASVLLRYLQRGVKSEIISFSAATPIWGKRSGSINTFLEAENKIYLVTNKEVLSLNCQISSGDRIYKEDISLSKNLIGRYKFSELFPDFPKNAYGQLSCEHYGESRNKFKMYLSRNLNGLSSSIQVMK